MTQRLPLGIDVGTSRVRIVAMRRYRGGPSRVESAAARDVPNTNGSSEPAAISSAIAEAIAEIGWRRGSCVLALPWRHAEMRCMEIPPMSASERLRAARLESALFVPSSERDAPTQVRVQPIDGTNVHLVVVASLAAIRSRMRIVSGTRLAVRAMDYEPFALQRAFPNADAILDVGFRQSRLYGRLAPPIRNQSIDGGGAAFTAAIAAALSIDIAQAERRKRSVGVAGACEEELDAFVRRVCDAVTALREHSMVRSLGVTGNGSRIPGLIERLTTAASVALELPMHAPEDAHSRDASFAFDFALAASLAVWAID